MDRPSPVPESDHTDLDPLRLIAIGRIPRCRDCPRYYALDRGLSEGAFDPLPDVPEGCTHPVCRPLAERHEAVLPMPRKLAI